MAVKPFFSLIKFLIRKLTHLQVINADLIPSEGAFILTSNHVSRLDIVFIMAISDRKDLVAIVAKKYQRKPFFRWVLEMITRIIWMDRQKTDFTAIREILDCLRKGQVIGIAPEGTRSHNATGMLEGKPGTAVLVARSGVPIVPIGIQGSEKVYDQWMKLRRAPVTIKVGEPYHLPEMDRDDRQAWLDRSTDEIMCQIAALLPPEYRGFYADHPRLKALLAKSEGEGA